VDASFEQLTHREVRDGHGSILAPVQPPRVKVRPVIGHRNVMRIGMTPA
jgi:hypothetical protein